MGKDQNDIFGGGGGGLDGAATSGSSSSSGSSSDESVEIRKHHPVTNQPRPMMPMPMAAATKHGRLFDNLVVLDNLPEAEVGDGGKTVAVGSVMGGDVDDDCDELFLLPESVLAMDSASFREVVWSVAPSVLNTVAIAAASSSPHNSLDSTDSARSLRGAAAASACAEESSDGLLRMARASEGCKTLWLCEFYSALRLLSR